MIVCPKLEDAVEVLKQQGTQTTIEHLRVWRDREPAIRERYEKRRIELTPRLERNFANDLLDNARRASLSIRLAIEHTLVADRRPVYRQAPRGPEPANPDRRKPGRQRDPPPTRCAWRRQNRRRHPKHRRRRGLNRSCPGCLRSRARGKRPPDPIRRIQPDRDTTAQLARAEPDLAQHPLSLPRPGSCRFHD